MVGVRIANRPCSVFRAAMPFSNCPRFLHRPRTDFTSDNLDLDPKEIKKMDERLKGGCEGVVGTTSPPPLLPHLEGLWLGWRSTATFFAVGCGGGVFGSALGLGGGVIVVPLLVHLGLTQAQAHGTSLVSVAGNAVAASYTYLSGGFVELSAAALLAITAIPTSRLGVHVASRVNGAQLRRYFGWWVIQALSAGARGSWGRGGRGWRALLPFRRLPRLRRWLHLFSPRRWGWAAYGALPGAEWF